MLKLFEIKIELFISISPPLLFGFLEQFLLKAIGSSKRLPCALPEAADNVILTPHTWQPLPHTGHFMEDSFPWADFSSPWGFPKYTKTKNKIPNST